MVERRKHATFEAKVLGTFDKHRDAVELAQFRAHLVLADRQRATADLVALLVLVVDGLLEALQRPAYLGRLPGQLELEDDGPQAVEGGVDDLGPLVRWALRAQVAGQEPSPSAWPGIRARLAQRRALS